MTTKLLFCRCKIQQSCWTFNFSTVWEMVQVPLCWREMVRKVTVHFVKGWTNANFVRLLYLPTPSAQSVFSLDTQLVYQMPGSFQPVYLHPSLRHAVPHYSHRRHPTTMEPCILIFKEVEEKATLVSSWTKHKEMYLNLSKRMIFGPISFRFWDMLHIIILLLTRRRPTSRLLHIYLCTVWFYESKKA